MKKFVLLLALALALCLLGPGGYFDGNGARAASGPSVVEDPGSGGLSAPCDAARSGNVRYLTTDTSYSIYGNQRYVCRFSDGWSLYSYSRISYFGNYAGVGNYTPGWYMWWPYDCICRL